MSTETTGAYKVENRVFIVPCRICLKPAEDILRAVEILNRERT